MNGEINEIKSKLLGLKEKNGEYKQLYKFGMQTVNFINNEPKLFRKIAKSCAIYYKLTRL